jgi:hypothetical protein
MPVSNQRSGRNLDPQEIQAFIQNARSSYTSYKQSASQAVANAYMAYQELQSKHATSEGVEWLAKEIDKRNILIDEENKKLKELQKRVKDFQSGKLEKDKDWIFDEPKDPKGRKMIEDEISKLKRLQKQEKEVWQSQRLVRIEQREGASSFTQIVKFVFAFDRTMHAPVISRFCTAMEWIELKCKGGTVEDADAIVELIDRFGGFEDVLEEMRLRRGGDNQDSIDREEIAKQNLSEIKEILKVAPALSTFQAEARFASDNFLMLLARSVGGNIDVVAEIPCGDNEINRFMARHEDPVAMPVPPVTEFIARMLKLGELVADNSEDEAKSAVDPNEVSNGGTRTITLRTMSDGNPEFIISARGADSSPVIYVYPRSDIHLGTPALPVFMQGKTRKRLEKKVDSYNKRRKIEFSFDPQPKKADGKPAESPMSWVACHESLKEIDSSNAIQQYYWSDMSKTTYRPLEVFNFRPQFEAKVGADDIKTMFNVRMEPWLKDKGSQKAKRTLTVGYKSLSEEFKLFCIAFEA